MKNHRNWTKASQIRSRVLGTSAGSRSLVLSTSKERLLNAIRNMPRKGGGRLSHLPEDLCWSPICDAPVALSATTGLAFQILRNSDSRFGKVNFKCPNSDYLIQSGTNAVQLRVCAIQHISLVAPVTAKTVQRCGTTSFPWRWSSPDSSRRGRHACCEASSVSSEDSRTSQR